MTATVEACSSCGAPTTPATSFLSDRGVVCAVCFGRLQNQQERANVKAERLSDSLTRRAWYLGGAHAIWAVTAVLAADWAHLPSWLSSILIVAALVLCYCLRLRLRSAYVAAVGLDAAGALACLAWGVVGAIRGPTWLPALLAFFPLALLGLTWTLRHGYREEADPDGLRRRNALGRWLPTAAVAASLVGIGVHVVTRPRPDPARVLVQELLPGWVSARSHGEAAGEAPSQAMLEGARPWPGVAAALAELDRAWPDVAAVRERVKAVNGALAAAGLPYVLDVWAVGGRPVLLTHRLLARIPWRIGARSVDVLRLRRLDDLNVELGLLGATFDEFPAVMLDRVEAALARDLPAMFAKGDGSSAAKLNGFDRAALARQRAWLESRLGPGIGAAAAAIGERDRLLEEMRARLNGGNLQLGAPDGLFLGDEWLARVAPLADPMRSGGRLVVEQDLESVARADRKLRESATAKVLADTVELLALATEGHEARHALDETDPTGPPPPQLFEVMAGSSTAMVGMADKELRAYLGELHDAPAPACLTLARMMRGAYGRFARPTPHTFATLAILGQLDHDPDGEPEPRLAALCGVPDAALRRRVADAWQKLYAAPMPAGQRLATP